MERLGINQNSAKQADCTSRTSSYLSSVQTLVDWWWWGTMPPNAWGIAGYTNQCNLVSLCLLLLPTYSMVACYMLLQAKVEEPRAADTEGPDMNPQDATDATRAGSRAKRWQWFVWLADCSDFFVSSLLSHGWSFCNLLHIAFQHPINCFGLISSNTWNGSGCDRTKLRNPKLKLCRRIQRPAASWMVPTSSNGPIVWRQVVLNWRLVLCELYNVLDQLIDDVGISFFLR